MFHTIRQGTLEYLTADALEGSVHCFSTRLGGVSEGQLSSLNLGTHRGDKPENVRENYRILGKAVGFAPEETVFTRQEHTDLLLRVGRADCGTGLDREQTTVCDGILTDEPGVALVCFAADCTPVLLFDPVRQAIAAVHAGWRGTAQGIAYKAVLRMQEEFGCAPEDIRAAIGKSLDGKTITDDLTFSELLLAHSFVAVVPGSPFGAPGFVRLSYAAADTVITQAMERISSFMHALQ